MQTTLYAEEIVTMNGDLSEITSKEHEVVIDIPERFHPINVDGHVQLEYDEGKFSLNELLVFRGGCPALALWDRDTYKEFDFFLPIISDKAVKRTGSSKLNYHA